MSCCVTLCTAPPSLYPGCDATHSWVAISQRARGMLFVPPVLASGRAGPFTDLRAPKAERAALFLGSRTHATGFWEAGWCELEELEGVGAAGSSLHLGDHGASAVFGGLFGPSTCTDPVPTGAPHWTQRLHSPGCSPLRWFKWFARRFGTLGVSNSGGTKNGTVGKAMPHCLGVLPLFLPPLVC